MRKESRDLSPFNPTIFRNGQASELIERAGEHDMSVAILALAFREPSVLAAAVPFYRAAGFDVFVHLDAKVSAESYADAMGPSAGECWFLTRRRSIYWAGFTMVEAMIDLMEAATSAGRYTNFTLVSD